MGFPRRVNWLDGRYANVDGIPFTMPVRTRTSPALFAVFSVDGAAAQAMLPADELHAWRFGQRGLLAIAVVDYRDTTIGPYVEFCVGVVVSRSRRPVGPIAPLLRPGHFGTGVYIYDLPVSSEISVKGGLGIWGMPKRQANLDFLIEADRVTSQYDLDGELVVRIDIPRPRSIWLPGRMNAVGWGADFRGLLTKSYIYARGRMGFHLRPSGARLLLGDHPRAAPLKALDIDPRPLFTGFMPRLDGVLDDHVESWYLTTTQPPPEPEVGMRDVVDLQPSQDWLDPPDRGRSDRLLLADAPLTHEH